MNFETVREEWNEYKLENGGIMRVRVVPAEFVMTNEKTEAGEPVIVAKSSILLHYIGPEEKKK